MLYQESVIHGKGLFAVKDFDDSCAALPVEGALLVCDSLEGILNVVIGDGVPRYLLGHTDTLRKACAGHESVRDGAAPTLKPHPTSPWFYMNSSFVAVGETPKVSNVTADHVFSKRKLRAEDNVNEILADECSGCVVKVNGSVKKGEGLIFGYPYASGERNTWGGEDSVEGEGGSGAEYGETKSRLCSVVARGTFLGAVVYGCWCASCSWSKQVDKCIV